MYKMDFCLREMCVEKLIFGRHENTNLGPSFFSFLCMNLGTQNEKIWTRDERGCLNNLFF